MSRRFRSCVRAGSRSLRSRTSACSRRSACRARSRSTERCIASKPRPVASSTRGARAMRSRGTGASPAVLSSGSTEPPRECDRDSVGSSSAPPSERRRARINSSSTGRSRCFGITARSRPRPGPRQARLGSRTLTAAIKPRREDLIGVTYTDPRGGARFCYHTEVADLEMRLIDGREKVAEVTRPASAAFEYASETPLAGVPLLA